jgi:hypothetical protein
MDNETIEISYYAVMAYEDQLKKDLETRMNNHPDFGPEDEVFLKDTILRCQRAQRVYLNGPRGHNLVKKA